MITCITPTRDRHHIFNEIITCINNQTVKPDKWIIVDDGTKPLSDDILSLSNVQIDYIRMPIPDPNIKTHTINARAGLHRVSEGSVFIIDDDDYYAPTYIEKMSHALTTYDIVGPTIECDYSLIKNAGYNTFNRTNFASNHHTAFNCSILDSIHNIIDNTDNPCMDKLVWRWATSDPSVKSGLVEFSPFICVSLKSWPGVHNGYVKNHRRSFLGKHDDDLKYFNYLLGSDAIRYSRYIHG